MSDEGLKIFCFASGFSLLISAILLLTGGYGSHVRTYDNSNALSPKFDAGGPSKGGILSQVFRSLLST